MKAVYAILFVLCVAALEVARQGGYGSFNWRFWESECDRLDRRCAAGLQGGSINAGLVCGFGNLFAGPHRTQETCRRMNLALDDPGAWRDASGSETQGPMPIRMADVTGEWFNGYRGRHLRLRGSFWNDSDESLKMVNCVGVLEVVFADGHPSQTAESGAACGFPEGMKKREMRYFRETDGIPVDSGWLDYPISRVRLSVRLEVRTALDQRFAAQVLDVDVPLPSAREPFQLVR